MVHGIPQRTLFNDYYTNIYNNDFDPYDEMMEEYDNAQCDYMHGKITKKQFAKKCKKIGVDEYGNTI